MAVGWAALISMAQSPGPVPMSRMRGFVGGMGAVVRVLSRRIR